MTLTINGKYFKELCNYSRTLDGTNTTHGRYVDSIEADQGQLSIVVDVASPSTQ